MGRMGEQGRGQRGRTKRDAERLGWEKRKRG